MRIMSYNIRHGVGMYNTVDLSRSANVIKRFNPDVCTLQEVETMCSRSGNVNQMKTLSELTGMPYYAFGEFMDYDGGQYGMGMLSKHPPAEISNHRLPDGQEPRSAIAGTITIDGQEIIVVGIHFYRTEQERCDQAATLIANYKDEKRPLILAGDFNSHPGTKVMQLIARHFVLPTKGEDHFTFDSVTPSREIDYIAYRPCDAFQLQEYKVIEEPRTSDHRPIIMDLRCNLKP